MSASILSLTLDSWTFWFDSDVRSILKLRCQPPCILKIRGKVLTIQNRNCIRYMKYIVFMNINQYQDLGSFGDEEALNVSSDLRFVGD